MVSQDWMVLEAQIEALQKAHIAANEVIQAEVLRLTTMQDDILVLINGDALKPGVFAAFMAEAESLQKRIMPLQFECTRLNAERRAHNTLPSGHISSASN